MKIVRGLLLGLLIALGLARATGYLAYAILALPSPFETYFLEAKMVLLALRAEQGLDQYPAWRDYPHVTNFYGPIYFGAVGLVGRGLGADIPGLFRIGRLASFGAGLLTSILVGAIAARRSGRGAGIAGGLLGLAVGPMIGFSVMTRPDTTAEFLGIAGFFLAGGRRGATRAAGVAVLALAMLTKQTTAIFLAAAALGWFCQGWRWRGVRLGLAGGAAVGLVIGGVTLGVEPSFAASLLGEGKAPWDLGAWTLTSTRLATWSPDLLYFPAVGLVLWAGGATGRRDAPLAALAALLLATSVATAAKLGSDLNYYLNLRVVEILAVGALWQAWAVAPGRGRSAVLAVAALLGCLAVVPGVAYNALLARAEWRKAAELASPGGRGTLDFYRSLYRLAADPRSRLLTDSGLVQLYQGDRAPFGDPFLFRVMVNTGRIDPTLIRGRIDAGEYDVIVTTRDVNSPSYDTYDFALPRALAERVRARYVAVDRQAGLFLYGRRPAPR